MLTVKLSTCVVFSIFVLPVICQSGPDPWHHDSKPHVYDEENLPPDLRMLPKRQFLKENKLGTGEWFFKRTLAILLKGGQVKTDKEDGSVDISLQMKYDTKKWDTLNECLKSDTVLTEDMFRRAIGYVEESIYKPSLKEQIVMAWGEYVQHYLTEYKTHITWCLIFLATMGGALWIWRHMSHRHAIILLFILFYAYEVFISYKEAEQKELEKFIAAVDQCKWYFWRSDCPLPSPDPLVFFKHMNPLKIGIRMFTTALAEPFVAISGTVNTILHGVTDGLWYPMDRIMYGILTVIINISFIYFLIMVIFNWLLNIPFHLGFFGFGISLKQRERNLFSNTTSQHNNTENTDRISQATLDRILNVCSLALTNNTQVNRPNISTSPALTINSNSSLKRSASTGRLPNFASHEMWNSNVRRRKNDSSSPQDGSGDARKFKNIPDAQN